MTIGRDLFEDIDVDAYEVELDMEQRAKALIDEWGSKLTEKDLIRLNAMVHAEGSNAEYSIAAYALEYYMTKNYYPERIDVNKFSLKQKPWWKFW